MPSRSAFYERVYMYASSQQKVMQVFQPKEVLQNNFTEETDQDYNTTVGPMLLTDQLHNFKFAEEEEDEHTYARTALDERIRAMAKSSLRMQGTAWVEEEMQEQTIEEHMSTSRNNLMIGDPL